LFYKEHKHAEVTTMCMTLNLICTINFYTKLNTITSRQTIKLTSTTHILWLLVDTLQQYSVRS